MNQHTIPCSVYRGGTSRGVFFMENDLPKDVSRRHNIFLQAIGSHDVSQVDGLGGRNSHTSKIAVINESSEEGTDIDYTFVQLSTDQNIIDYKGTCENLMSAVGAFAVNENLVPVTEPLTTVRVYNTNIDKYLEIDVSVENGAAAVDGDFYMAGLTRPGAKIVTKILAPGGTLTNATLPHGKQFDITADGQLYKISFVDLVNPFVYVKAEDLGLGGNETNETLQNNQKLMDTLEGIRRQAAVTVGLVENSEDISASVPKLAIVSSPKDYVTGTGQTIKSNETDIVTKMISVGNVHHSFAVSGLMNIAAAALLNGTLPDEVCRQKDALQKTQDDYTVRVGHPGGVSEVKVALDHTHNDIFYTALDRHARCIIKGDLMIPDSLFR
jgi:2-methylaconitate cis-trans-isomerase PrpF